MTIDSRTRVGDYVRLQRGTTYRGNLVGLPGPVLLGLGSIEAGGGFREGHYKTFGGDCPEKLMLYPGDMYVALKGATKDGSMIGSVARVPLTVKSGRLTQDTAKLELIQPTPDVARHLYWMLRTPQYRQYCAGRAIGTGAVALSRNDFLAYPIPPPSPVTRQLIELLENIESKVELIRRGNETLDAVGRALFKAWFVDFEHVRARAERRDPLLPSTLADLFPARFTPSLTGAIPDGWSVGSILQQSRLVSGGTPRTQQPEYWGGSIGWASAKDVSQSTGTFLIDTERTITQRGLDESATQLIPRFSTVVVARGATTGRLVLLGRELAMNQTCYALVSTHEAPFSLYYQVAHSIASLVHAAHGSVFDTITTNTFATSNVVLPPLKVLKAFECVISPMLRRTLLATEQSVTLGALRDTLLPKLLDGELHVKPLEHLVESFL